MTRVIAVQGADGPEDVPGLIGIAHEAELRFSKTAHELRAALPGAEILLGWDFRAEAVRSAWPAADRLRWIHWGGAGVDALLFDELVASDVVITNSRGVFDRAMAEYVLGLIIAFTKRFPETWTLQARRTWKHRLTDCFEERRVLVVGVGSIGRTIARLCKAAGMAVTGVGRGARATDPDFGIVHACESLSRALADADFVVIAAPLTAQTRGLFGAEQFRAMKPSARLINVGRGPIVREHALVAALESKQIAGAALDVFETEPLAEDSPLWSLPDVIVSPHMSGDFEHYAGVLARVFEENFERYRAGEPLLNRVDKALGYVPGD